MRDCAGPELLVTTTRKLASHREWGDDPLGSFVCGTKRRRRAWFTPLGDEYARESARRHP